MPASRIRNDPISDSTLSIFPLTSVVLFPRLRIPLYIFEPRYREMIRDELSADRTIGMVAIPPTHAHEASGEPAVYPIGCAGHIDQSRRRDDGTFEIMLQATSRFRILEELRPRPDQLYRSARVEWLPEESIARSTDDDDADLAMLRSEVQASMCQLLEQIAPDQVARLQADGVQQLDDHAYVNSLSVSLDFSTPERQHLLEANNLTERYESMVALVQFRIAQAQGPTPSDSTPIQ